MNSLVGSMMTVSITSILLIASAIILLTNLVIGTFFARAILYNFGTR